jgi:hypothetical protein
VSDEQPQEPQEPQAANGAAARRLGLDLSALLGASTIRPMSDGESQ